MRIYIDDKANNTLMVYVPTVYSLYPGQAVAIR